ncbi:exosortase [Marinobacter changyiensis]|uniref:exosortase n=1 Tax=Marinobacter changyiensis TaxID=2604091 RepID=UPI0012640DFB|nr:exosortase [Marinobacter changyiensis]
MERIRSLAGSRWFSPSLFLVFFVVATWPAWLTLADRWLKFDESYSHGFLILAVSAYLSIAVWRRERPKPGFYWPWVLPLLAAAAVYSAGSILLIGTFEQLALIPILLGGLLVLWGWRQTLAFFVPVGLMAFTLPLWGYLTWPLQLISVAVNQFMLSWFDIEFMVEGVFVYFPNIGAFEISEDCSGLRYFLVGVTLAFLYGELNFDRLRSRILLLVVAMALALLANWVRVFIIIYIGYETNMTSSLIDDHDMLGWWVFAATLIPLFFIARRLELRERRAATVNRSEKPLNHNHSGLRSMPGFGLVFAVLPLLAIAMISWLAVPSEADSNTSNVRQHSVALVDTDSWLPLFEQRLAGWQPSMQNPDRILEKTYMKREGLGVEGEDGEQIFIGLYTYNFQRPGGEVVYDRNRLYDPSAQLLERTFAIESETSAPLGGLTLRYRRSDEEIHIAYGYYVEGRWETNELQAKLAQLPGILNARTDASLLVIGLRCENCESEERLKQLAPEIQIRAIDYLDKLYESGNDA